MSQQLRLGIIGGGRLANSLVAGWLHAGNAAQNIWLSDPHLEKREYFQRQYAIQAHAENAVVAAHVDILLLAVKPKDIAKACAEIATVVRERQVLVISVATGITCQQFQRWLAGYTAVVRAMPNIAGQIGSSATGLFATAAVTEEQCSQAESVLRNIGAVVWVTEEDYLDIVTALSGSGPAYFFEIIEAFALAATRLGLPAATANLLAKETALGAAQLAMQSTASLSELIATVVSPGGTTAAALASLRGNDINSQLAEAVAAAYQRAKAMGQENDQN